MAQVIFFIAAIGAIAGALGVVTVRSAFYSVLSLVTHLLCLALLFLLLRAEFVAAAQVVVYAGAVMVLYVFVVSYVGADEEGLVATATSKPVRGLTVAFALALFAVLAIAVLGSGLDALSSRGAPYRAETGAAARFTFGTPGEVGRLLLTQFLLPFEVASFLLLAAAVGAVTLARRRGGLETDAELRTLTAIDFVRPADTGTMAEGVSGRRRLPAPKAAEEQPGAPEPEDVGVHVASRGVG